MNLAHYTQTYGVHRWRQLIAGPASNYDGPTLVLCLRRKPTNGAEAERLIPAADVLQRLYREAVARSQAASLAYDRHVRSRAVGDFAWPETPEWPESSR